MNNTGFGHLKTRLLTIKTSKNVGLGGPWYIYIYIFDKDEIISCDAFVEIAQLGPFQ